MTRTQRRLAALGTAIVAVAVAGLVWFFTRPSGPQRSSEAVAAAFVERWQSGAWDGLDELVLAPATAAGEYERLADALDLDGMNVVVDAVDSEGDRGRAAFSAILTLGGLGEWRYEGRLALVRSDGKWWVDWSPEAIHPDLDPGQRLDRIRTWPERAPIVGTGGDVVVGPHEMIDVGIEPRRIDDRDELLEALETHLDLEPDAVVAELERPGVQPDWFVPLTRLRPDRYEAVRPDIYSVPGTVFRRTEARVTPQRDLATHVTGRTGEVTAELLDRWGHPYVRGDTVGLSGLELVFQEQLAGRPSGDVRIVDGAGDVVTVLHHFPGEAPAPLQTTLDLDVQLAAEAALEGIDAPAAIVAVDPMTGEIRAAASRPADELNRALAARYPPGSTFKIVTAAAAIEGDPPALSTFSCPAEVTVGGRSVRNAGGEARGAVSLEEAFAESCNTVFAPLAVEVGADALVRAAEQFGFGAEYELPLPVAGGRFPRPGDDAELAAAGIGQGRVEASPLHMATVAAAVADGAWRVPTLVADAESADERSLGSATRLRSLMRAVVQSGTGQGADVGGREVAGKTGTAEFGDDEPPRTHAWFVGYSGEVAVAVFVEDGGSGGSVAAPIAARFFDDLP